MFLDCLPSISWWIAYLEDKDPIFIKHTFQKQSALSQYELLGPNGRLKLSIPTKKASRKGWYEYVEISYEEDWISDHLRSLDAAYAKSPFYQFYNYKLEAVFKQKHTNLVELNQALLNFCLGTLKTEKLKSFESNTKMNYVPIELRAHDAYDQVFDDRHAFEENLSILDLLFNLGPEAADYLASAST